MSAIRKGNNAIHLWIKKLVQCFYKRARKETKYAKNKPPKLTAWEIIQSLT